MIKIKTMNLIISKIQLKENNDWCSVELDDLDPGLYICENPDGGMFLMTKMPGGERFGLWLPVSEIGKIYAREAEQKVFEQIKPILEKGFGDIESGLKKIESLANDNNIILNESEDVAKENAQTIAQSLVNLEKQFKELPKQTEGQKSSLSEMAEAVVNIIKATK